MRRPPAGRSSTCYINPTWSSLRNIRLVALRHVRGCRQSHYPLFFGRHDPTHHSVSAAPLLPRPPHLRQVPCCSSPLLSSPLLPTHVPSSPLVPCRVTSYHLVPTGLVPTGLVPTGLVHTVPPCTPCHHTLHASCHMPRVAWYRLGASPWAPHGKTPASAPAKPLPTRSLAMSCASAAPASPPVILPSLCLGFASAERRRVMSADVV